MTIKGDLQNLIASGYAHNVTANEILRVIFEEMKSPDFIAYLSDHELEIDIQNYYCAIDVLQKKCLTG